MTHRLKRFAALSLHHKSLLVQAWCLLGWYRVLLLLMGFRRLTGSLQRRPASSPPADPAPERLELAIVIGRLVASASQVTPWQSKCLVQVLTARRLLASRGIAGSLHLGVRRVFDPVGVDSGLAAHAWLRCSGTIVNGASGHDQFVVLSEYSW